MAHVHARMITTRHVARELAQILFTFHLSPIRIHHGAA